MLVHGEAGVGKTWLLGSAPPPVCFVDLEGRSRFLPYPKVRWDAKSEEPPTPSPDWTHAVVLGTEYSTIEKAFQWMQSGKHAFRSFVVDSLSFAQKRFIAKMAGTQQMKTDEWGEVLRVMEAMIRDCCDLPLQSHNTIELVAFSSGTKTEEGRTKPLLQGQLKDGAAYMFDAVGYMYLGQDGSGAATRNLLVQPNAGIVAKDNTSRLGGPVIVNPNLTQLHELINTEVPLGGGA